MTINTGTAIVDIDEIEMGDNDAAVTLVGSNDVTVLRQVPSVACSEHT